MGVISFKSYIRNFPSRNALGKGTTFLLTTCMLLTSVHSKVNIQNAPASILCLCVILQPTAKHSILIPNSLSVTRHYKQYDKFYIPKLLESSLHVLCLKA